MIRKASKGDRTREKIVVASIGLFYRFGFAQTSFQKIATSCRIGQTAIFHHFEDKYALLHACVEHILDHMMQIVRADLTVTDSALNVLVKNFYANYHWATQFKSEAALIIFLYYTSTHDPRFQKIYEHLLEQVRQKYYGYVLQGQREGLFKIEHDSKLIAEILHENIIGSIINILACKAKPNQVQELETKWLLLIQLLTGHTIDRKALPKLHHGAAKKA
ncbi:TetR/AcrR family transcriptional regulator [Bdellovibrionota bacterium FG-1]